MRMNTHLTVLQMDWIGDKLSALIEQGRRALGAEVVVMSETKEDEVDDGLGAWVEEDDRMNASTSASIRGRHRSRPSNIGIMSPPPSYASPPATPHRNRWDGGHMKQPSFSSLSSAPPLSAGLSLHSVKSRPSSRRPSVSSSRSFVPPLPEEDTLESPELREAMQQARLAYMQRKMQTAQVAAEAS